MDTSTQPLLKHLFLCLIPSPPLPHPPPPALSSVNLFFCLEVQRLSCPQHVLVLRSTAAGTCDDRVCECRGAVRG